MRAYVCTEILVQLGILTYYNDCGRRAYEGASSASGETQHIANKAPWWVRLPQLVSWYVNKAYCVNMSVQT